MTISNRQLSLTIPTSTYDRSMGVSLPVSVEPLLPERLQEGGEECETEGRIEYGLNLTDDGIWASSMGWGDCLARRDNSGGHIEQELEDGIFRLFIVWHEF